MAKMKTLSQRQEVFAYNIVQSVKPKDAYAIAGYSPKNAGVDCHKLLKNPKVQARIKELRDRQAKELIAKTIASKLEAGQVATEIMRARFADFDIDNLTREHLSSPAIREIMRTKGGGKDGKSPWVSTKVKLESPLAAAEYLAKLYGWYEALPESFQDNRVINFVLTGAQSKELIEGISKRLLTDGNGDK